MAYAIDDEHHSAHRVRSVELLVAVAIDPITSSLVFASFLCVTVHSNSWWEVFLSLVIILMSSQSFQIGGSPCLLANLVTS